MGATALAVLVLTGALAVLYAAPASAHPLGLPSFASIEAGADGAVEVAWTAAADDVAALARQLGLDAPPEGLLTEAQDAALAASTELRDYVREHLVVTQDGRRCPADLSTASVVLEGLRTIHRCPGPINEVEVRLALLIDVDPRYRTIASAATPEGPSRLLFSGDRSSHRVELAVGARAETQDRGLGAQTGSGLLGGSLPLEQEILAVVERATGPAAVALGLGLALLVGAAHGLAPGHGKAIAAAYLVGDRGRPIHALQVGITVALMHTASVLVLALVVHRAFDRSVVQAVAGWGLVASGAVVLGAGLWLLRRRLGRAGHAHAHLDGHAHHQEQASDVEAADGAPLSRAGILALGAGGGLLPSPTALLVVLTGLTIGRTGLALGLVTAFSLGLAATVTLAGLAAVWGRDLLVSSGSELAGRLHRKLPLLGGVGVCVLGLVLLVRGALAL